MESFRNISESHGNILDYLSSESYTIEDYEIQDVINRLYELVGINEDYIDEAIFAIEKLCDNNEEFKKEWFDALDDVESEVLEEGKMGKLTSIALLALSMGISLTGCDVAPQLPTKSPRVETSVDILNVEEPVKEEPTEITDKKDREEINMEETKPTYEEIKNDITWYTKSFVNTGSVLYLNGGEPNIKDTPTEVKLTDEERNDTIMVNGGETIIPRKVTHEGGKVYYSINGGEMKMFNPIDPPYTC